jgi:peptide/nickel transport system ATP-binding protein
MMDSTDAILEITNLKTYFRLDDGLLKAVDGVSLSIEKQKTLGVIGESGCGKSVTAQSVLRIVPPPGRIMEGRIMFRRQDSSVVDLAQLDPFGPAIRDIRGKEISMIFQEPMTSLSPVHTIGAQIMESILLHQTPNKAEARELAMDMLGKVGISNSRQRMNEYPNQLSGGLRQRAMIAMALSCHPSLLIADEPTTALDVTVQAQILDLMADLQRQLGMAMLYITHDLGVIAEIADEVMVMYLGYAVERTTARNIFTTPLHPYTALLLKSIPKVGRKARERLDAISGTVPIPMNRPQECPFASRCPQMTAGTCDSAVPPLVEVRPGHLVRCFQYARKE